MPGWVRSLRRWPRTVRGRVVIASVLATGVLLAVAGVVALQIQESSQKDRLEDNLTARAADVAALVASGSVPAQLSGGGEYTAAQLVDADGQVVAATPGATVTPLSDARPAPGERSSTETSGVLEEDHDGLVVALGVSDGQQEYTVIATESFENIDDSIGVLRRTLLIGLPILLVAVGVITSLAVGRALAPVERARRQLSEMGSESLDRRVSVPRTQDEIARLTETMNALLDRLEEAYRREQRFVADASHELRNPIATLRSNIELDLAAGRGDAQTLAEVARLENLVDDLLHLARRFEGAPRPPSELVDLDEVVLEEAARAASGGVVIDRHAVSGAQVRGVRLDLVRLVRNLIENAARHGDGRVALALTEGSEEAELLVDDDGPGIPEGEREAVFERFARLDGDRGRASGGTGLGLAIVRDIADEHGGSITVEAAALGGARFRLRLPAATGASGEPDEPKRAGSVANRVGGARP
jgi:signal transduction histidine kinase